MSDLHDAHEIVKEYGLGEGVIYEPYVDVEGRTIVLIKVLLEGEFGRLGS